MYDLEKRKSNEAIRSTCQELLNFCSEIRKVPDPESKGLFKNHITIANISYYKLNIMLDSIRKLVDHANPLAEALSSRIPGLSIELYEASIKTLNAQKDLLECLNKEGTEVTNYDNYKQSVNKLQDVLLSFNEIYFGALERYTIVYNQNN